MAFSEVLASLAPDAGDYRTEPPEDWRQGRTLFGGVLASVAVASPMSAFPELPPLRSAQLMFMAPVTGGLVIKPRILRAGKSTTLVTHVNILEDPELCQTIKTCSNWPTFPQLYIDGEMVGGYDIAMDMYRSGDLSRMVKQVAAVLTE